MFGPPLALGVLWGCWGCLGGSVWAQGAPPVLNPRILAGLISEAPLYPLGWFGGRHAPPLGCQQLPITIWGCHGSGPLVGRLQVPFLCPSRAKVGWGGHIELGWVHV